MRTFTVIGTRLAELSLWNAAKSPTTRTFRFISSITHFVCSGHIKVWNVPRRMEQRRSANVSSTSHLKQHVELQPVAYVHQEQ